MNDNFIELIELIKKRNMLLSELMHSSESSNTELDPILFREFIFRDEYDHRILVALHELRDLIERLENNQRKEVLCPLVGESGDSNPLHAVIAETFDKSKKEARNEGLKEIRDFTREAESLIIIDPYMYGGEASKSREYVDEFARVSRIKARHMKRIHIIYSSNHGKTKKIMDDIKDLARENDCILTDYDTDKIHDRVWIADRKRAIVVGTSLGGIGNRLSFILELPKYDLSALIEYLNDKNLI
ncbi:hypothetical protein [Paenibacillus sp. FSL H8-0079]